MKSGDKAIKLMLSFEGMDQPGSWPGGSSGVSIGHGYDLGYEASFESDWKGLLPADVMKRLRATLGLKGERAHQAARGLRDIRIPMDVSDQVFRSVTLPREEALTVKVFPGSDTLPPNAFGALVSLVYNRGALVDKSDRRKEMLALAVLFRKGAPYDLKEIASLVEAQKRLWPDVRTSDGDLHDRRIAEAKLIRES